MNYRSVIVSGQPFSGRTSLARKVAEELEFDFYSTADFLNGTTRGAINKFRSDFDTALKHGRVVVDTPYATAHNPAALRVWLSAPLSVRAERLIADGFAGSKNDAQDRLLHNERYELEVGRMLWGTAYDYRDRKMYQIKILVDQQSVEQEALQVLHLMGAEAEPKPESPLPVAKEEMSKLEFYAYHLNNSGVQ